jgi:hypothetical protein
MRVIALATMVLCFGSAAPGLAAAQTANDLVGTWRPVSVVVIHQDGTTADEFGPHPQGIAIFESNGRYFSLTLRPDLPKFASGKRNTGTSEENQAIVQGSIAHYGTYTVADKVVTFKVEGSTWPGWAGTDQKRTLISFTGDELKWSLAAAVGGTAELVYKRVK